MILRPQLEVTDHQSVLDYYLANYGEVHIVTCSKCGTDLAIEIRGQVFGQSDYKVNEMGFTVLPLGDNLLASRVRTDEHTPGQKMLGYQCGAKVANPAYANYEKELDAVVAEAKKNHEIDVKNYDAAYKDNLKHLPKGYDKPEYNPPEFVAPIAVNVPSELTFCGNDTRGNAIEEELSPTGTFLPHEVQAIQERYRQSGYKPKFKRKGNIETHETFRRERIK